LIFTTASQKYVLRLHLPATANYLRDHLGANASVIMAARPAGAAWLAARAGRSAHLLLPKGVLADLLSRALSTPPTGVSIGIDGALSSVRIAVLKSDRV
jgi:hypothetical protein